MSDAVSDAVSDAGAPDSHGAALAALPRGRIPTVGMREILAALHRRRERRQESARSLQEALSALSIAAERHLARIEEVRQAIEAQGGDLSALQHYDNLMARLRAELRSAEREMADAFRHAAGV